MRRGKLLAAIALIILLRSLYFIRPASNKLHLTSRRSDILVIQDDEDYPKYEKDQEGVWEDLVVKKVTKTLPPTRDETFYFAG